MVFRCDFWESLMKTAKFSVEKSQSNKGCFVGKYMSGNACIILWVDYRTHKPVAHVSVDGQSETFKLKNSNEGVSQSDHADLRDLSIKIQRQIQTFRNVDFLTSEMDKLAVEKKK